MPQRVHKMVERHPSDEVQGDDSWVEISRPTEADIRKQRKASVGGKDSVDIGFDILREHVIAWNWVDDDGLPFPQPSDDPTVISRLSDYELNFLLKFFHEPSAETLKN